MYIFIYVPATGCTAPAIARNRVGPLPAQSASGGGPVRARGGHLKSRGVGHLQHCCAFPRCSTPAVEAGSKGARPEDLSHLRLLPLAIAVGPCIAHFIASSRTPTEQPAQQRPAGHWPSNPSISIQPSSPFIPSSSLIAPL